MLFQKSSETRFRVVFRDQFLGIVERRSADGPDAWVAIKGSREVARAACPTEAGLKLRLV